MHDDSRQNLSAIIREIGLINRKTVLAGQNHRSTSCDRRSHKKRIRKEHQPWRPAPCGSTVIICRYV